MTPEAFKTRPLQMTSNDFVLSLSADVVWQQGVAFFPFPLSADTGEREMLCVLLFVLSRK